LKHEADDEKGQDTVDDDKIVGQSKGLIA